MNKQNELLLPVLLYFAAILLVASNSTFSLSDNFGPTDVFFLAQGNKYIQLFVAKWQPENKEICKFKILKIIVNWFQLNLHCNKFKSIINIFFNNHFLICKVILQKYLAQFFSFMVWQKRSQTLEEYLI